MDYIKEFFDPNEKPLDKFVPDGGFCGIFRTIGCIGDSISSGEFEGFNRDGKRCWIDRYDYSWGQYMARMIGSKVYNFSRGGMTAKAYMEWFAAENDFFNPDLACQAYVILLGSNDITELAEKGGTLGSINDIKADYTENTDTFAGHYAAIIAKYQSISPAAKFFLCTLPDLDYHSDTVRTLRDEHRQLIYDIHEKFGNTYVMDIRQHAPRFDATFRHYFFQEGHRSAAGYKFDAKMITSYMDYIIRHNMNDFRKVGMYEIGLH